MEQKQLVTGSSCETAGELRRRILDLEEQNRVLDAFIENSTDAIQISDRNLVTLRINRAYEVLTGIRRDELVGVPVEELVKKAGGIIAGKMAVLAEGDAAHRDDIITLAPLPLFNADGSIKE